MDTISLWRRMFGALEQNPDRAREFPPEQDEANAAPPVAMHHVFRIGDRIAGRFEVHRAFGGGMGSVYVVYDHKDRQVLALKTFQDRPAEKRAEQRALEQSFQKEAEAWVAPYPRGRKTPRDYLRGEGLPLEQVLRWGIEFCHGMEHALSKGMLCRRDIKPGNFLIDRDGHMKVADFGLAATWDREESPESDEGYGRQDSQSR